MNSNPKECRSPNVLTVRSSASTTSFPAREAPVRPAVNNLFSRPSISSSAASAVTSTALPELRLDRSAASLKPGNRGFRHQDFGLVHNPTALDDQYLPGDKIAVGA